MGRDSTGKHQESGQLAGNQAQAAKDYAGRDKAVGQYDASVDSLAKNPGYAPTDLQAMRAEQGDQISAIHGNDATQLRQNAAETGNANDAGLYSQLRAVSDARSRDAAMGNNNIAGAQAQQVLETRRMLPGMRFQPAQLYSGSSSNLTNANTSLITGRQQADQTTPLWAQMGMTAMSAAGAAASCPVEGSLYLMADGSEKPVEDLVVGDQIMGVDDEPETIEEIQSGMSQAIEVCTENGHRVRNSLTHAFVLPKGGFTVAARSMGKTILTAEGPSKVATIEPVGLALVFNVITNGSHSYRADGVWALGVGEAERHVNMQEWREIGEHLVENELLAK